MLASCPAHVVEPRQRRLRGEPLSRNRILPTSSLWIGSSATRPPSLDSTWPQAITYDMLTEQFDERMSDLVRCPLVHQTPREGL